jgi:flagellar biosynthetic protein FliO
MDLLAQVASVTCVLALLAITLWWLRRRGLCSALPRRGNARLLESVERLPLGPQHTLHLVRLGQQALLVACSPSGCTLVATRDWPEMRGRGALP